jgi:hypothetical protein
MQHERRAFKKKFGYPERTSGIECGIPAAGDHLNSRLEAAPTEDLSNGAWTFQISRKKNSFYYARKIHLNSLKDTRHNL